MGIPATQAAMECRGSPTISQLMLYINMLLGHASTTAHAHHHRQTNLRTDQFAPTRSSSSIFEPSNEESFYHHVPHSAPEMPQQPHRGIHCHQPMQSSQHQLVERGPQDVHVSQDHELHKGTGPVAFRRPSCMSGSRLQTTTTPTDLKYSYICTGSSYNTNPRASRSALMGDMWTCHFKPSPLNSNSKIRG